MSEKNYILRENATTQKTGFMDACTHTMRRLTALGVCFVTWLNINALWRKGIKICISAALTVTVSKKKYPSFWMVLSTHMLAGSKQERKTDEFGFIHLNNAFTYNIEALVHAKKKLYSLRSLWTHALITPATKIKMLASLIANNFSSKLKSSYGLLTTAANLMPG